MLYDYAQLRKINFGHYNTKDFHSRQLGVREAYLLDVDQASTNLYDSPLA